MVAWCRRGPELARVEAVDLRWEDYRGEFTKFSIVH
jgi:acylphosphatase